ncbi:MAG TPA: GEVED domain-containing protein [Flavobacterium sp.]|nr:GEVED domain-containing protein [Flavobacterium sp.]
MKTNWIIKLIALLFFCFLNTNLNAQSNSTFTSTGTWKCPQGVTTIQVEAYGGGGGGGYGGGTNKYGGGGGGGGAYIKNNSVTVTPNTTYNIIIGNGGIGGSTSTGVNANGTDGTLTSATFGTTTIIANPGIGGKGYNNGFAGGIGGVGGTSNGGNGASGSTTYSGGGGGGAGPIGNGFSATNSIGGNGNGGVAGKGGNGNTANFEDGIIGGNYGGGGGGGTKNKIGGNGAGGFLIITYTCPSNTVANAGSNQTLTACIASTTLAGNTPTYGIGTWSLISGTANILSINSPTTAITGLTIGLPTTLRWTISNGECGSTFSDVVINTSSGSGCLPYCIPTGNLDCVTKGDYITNVTLNTLINNSTCDNNGYTNFPATGSKTTIVTRGNIYNLTLGTGPGNKKHGAGVWIDFNQNSSFADAGEFFLIGNGVIGNSINTIPITIPLGATLGNTRMRVRYGTLATIASTSSCTLTGTYGETEDYTITINDPILCIAPINQPLSLILTPNGTSINGAFTAPSPAPDNYLVIVNTTGTPPIPINGTNYSIGSSIGIGNIVVDIDSNTGFIATGLSISSTYYFFIFSYNSACSGGPSYNLTNPLIGNATTLSSNYCTPSVSSGLAPGGYFSEVSFVGTLNDVSNSSTYTNLPSGYQDFTALTNLSKQAQGEGVNISVQALNSSFMKAWVDWNKDNVFDDSTELVYNTGSISTYSSTFGFIIPSNQPVGNYRIRIRLNTRDFSPPYAADANPNFTSCGNLANSGETEDYLFTVVSSCNAIISSITENRTCGSGTVNLNANSTSAGVTQYRWYTTPTGATLVGTTSTGDWTTPSLNNSTTYYVTAFNGCESLVRTAINAIVSPIPTLTYSPTNPIICGEDLVLNLSVSGDFEEVFLIDEKFNSGLGTFTNTNFTSSVRNLDTQWQNRTSTFVRTVIPNVNTWFPAISTGINGNSFVMSTSDFADANPYVHNQLASATLNTTNFVNLSLSLRLFFTRYFIDDTNLTLEYVTIDVSTDGGTSWNEIKRYNEDVGIGTRFETVSFDLSSYINQNNLKVRVRYYTNQWCNGLAVDDIKLYGKRPIISAFNWTSSTPINAFTDSACTNPYIANTPAFNVYIKPSINQLEEDNFTFTANVPLANGCSTSKTINIINNSKVWLGNSSDWNDPNNWKPNGVPTINDCIVIKPQANPSIISPSGYKAYGKNLSVKNNGVLEVQSNSSITINDFIKVENSGSFKLKNSASLVQIDNNGINSGIISMERTTNLKKSDYVYWSSPVNSFLSSNVSSGTSTSLIWKWNPTIANSNGGWGNWVSGNEIMQVGKGYIIRAPNTFSDTSTTPFTANFIGTPNNGTIQAIIARANNTTTIIGNNGTTITNLDDNWNLIGNPYPSAINATQFLLNNNTIEGSVRLWTHGSPISANNPNPFYGSFSQNYSINDFIIFNGIGSTPPGFDGKIAAGQSFFVIMNDGPTATSTVTFNNSLRNEDYNNSQFYKTKNPKQAISRVWLDIINESNNTATTLVGYTEGATIEKDAYYDALHKESNEMGIYSLINLKPMAIQGLPVPFNTNDIVPIGIKISKKGNYKIAINSFDGLFESQDIYLEDLSLQIIHNLKLNPYIFSSETGDYKNRFVLRYSNKKPIKQIEEKPTNIQVYANDYITIYSNDKDINDIGVYDALGKKIYTKVNINNNHIVITQVNKSNSTLILKIKIENEVFTKKIIF